MGANILIADFTGDPARVGLAAPGSAAVESPDDLLVPLRVALRQEGVRVVALAGEASAGVRADARTLVFNRLHRLLPRVADSELRSRLARPLWDALCDAVGRRGAARSADSYVGYVIQHHRWPQPVLEDFRAACADASVPLAGFINEGAALALGFVRSPLFAKLFPEGEAEATLCLAFAHDEASVEVLCFDLSAGAARRRELGIRDFFHTTCADLSRSLAGRAWAGAVTHLVSVENAGVSGEAQELVVGALQGACAGASKKRLQAAGTRRLKMWGANYVAQCRHGRGDAGAEYLISGSYNLGVQIDRHRFHPVLEGWDSRRSDYPRRAAHAYALGSFPERELRLNLFCGYSDRVGEAVPLGAVAVEAGELTRGAGGAPALNVSVALDAPGAGRFLIETSGGRPLGSQPFVLPGLVV